MVLLGKIYSDTVRSSLTEPLSLAGAVRAQVRALDPDQPVAGIRTLSQVVDASLSERRTYTELFGAFGLVALALATMGTYSVTSHG